MTYIRIKLLKALGIGERITRQRAITEIDDELLNTQSMLEVLEAKKRCLIKQRVRHVNWLRNIEIPDFAQETRDAEGLDYQLNRE